jgi:hypothetical protein
MTERFDMDGEKPEPPEPDDESYVGRADDRLESFPYPPVRGRKMTAEEWLAEHRRG